MESTHDVKDQILSDAIKTAIEARKLCEKLKIVIFVMALVMMGMVICMIGG